MRLCADYNDMIERFGVDLRMHDDANPIVRHVNALFGCNAWAVDRSDELIVDPRYRRGLANAARELRRLRREGASF